MSGLNVPNAQVQDCDDEVTREFCVDGEAVSGEWVKTCRLPDAVLSASMRNILLQNDREEVIHSRSSDTLLHSRSSDMGPFILLCSTS